MSLDSVDQLGADPDWAPGAASGRPSDPGRPAAPHPSPAGGGEDPSGLCRASQPGSELDRLLRRMLHRIRQSLELQDILDAAAIELQAFLSIDRVKIYRFHPDYSGQVIAECLRDDRRLPSLRGLNFPSDDIPPETRELYVQARIRSIVNVKSGLIGQSRVCDPETGELIAEDWAYRPLDPCHGEYLTAMGVMSSLCAPIFCGVGTSLAEHSRLWGLMVGHHSEPWEPSLEVLEGVQLVVEQLGVGIAQATLLAEARAKADHKSLIGQIAALLHSLPTIELQTALEATVAALGGSGGRLLMSEIRLEDETPMLRFDRPLRCFKCGSQPSDRLLAAHPHLEQFQILQERFGAQGKTLEPWAIDDLYELSSLRTWQPLFRTTNICGLLVVPLVVRGNVAAYMTIFRDRIATETLWAGKFDPDVRQTYPRQSFEAWRQLKSAQARAWTSAEVGLAKTLAQQFAAAIEQSQLYDRISALNAGLEQQVKERTLELEDTMKDLQRTQTQLVQTEKVSSLGQLVAGVAHEINNPVSFIHGNLVHVNAYAANLLELLHLYQKHYPEPDSEITDYLKLIDWEFVSLDLPRTLSSMSVGTARIREIVLSLRNFSRLDRAEVASVDLHEGIDSTLMILQHRLKAQPDRPEIILIKKYADLPLVECFAGQMNQVFMNLLGNAIDALDERDRARTREEILSHPSQLTIHTELLPDNQVVIRVDDNGPGIPETVRSHIFDPFFTTKAIGKGTGLGLSITHQIIVEKHGGRIECFSEVAQGTEFVVTIPLFQNPR